MERENQVHALSAKAAPRRRDVCLAVDIATTRPRGEILLAVLVREVLRQRASISAKSPPRSPGVDLDEKFGWE